MNSIEVSAKTLDDAITAALLQLGASSDQVNIEVLSEGNKVFGIFGKDAKVRATLKEDAEPVIDPVDVSDKAVEVKEVKEVVTATGEKVTLDDSLEKRIREVNANRGKKEEGLCRPEEKSRKDKPRREYTERRDAKPAEEAEEPKKPVVPAVSYEIPADADAVIEKLKAFLTDVLKAMGIEAEITAAFSKEGILEADIAGQTMGVIIGKRGSTLDSLQYLTTLAVNKGRSDHVHIKLDTEGYRKRRQETLENLALSIAKKVKKSGRKVTLEPMNPYERRIIHSVLQNKSGIETYSDGEEPYRKVIIAPARGSRK